jgi:hypothetical protein
MSIFRVIVFLFIFTAAITELPAEPRCPGNVASISIDFIQQTLIVVPVVIDGRGPFEFLVDTGAQITTVDTALANLLKLSSFGSTGVSGVSTFDRKISSYLHDVRIGSHAATEVLVVIDDLAQLRAADPQIEGILGEDFLMHFDLLIDNEHQVLCLDEPGAMSHYVRGPHISLEKPYGSETDLPFTRPLVISSHLHGSNKQITLFRLDSGSNVPLLYVPEEQGWSALQAGGPNLKRNVNGVEQTFAILAARDVEIGRQSVGSISFVHPLNSVGTPPHPREDGLLPTALFRRIFVSYRDGFVVITPR